MPVSLAKEKAGALTYHQLRSGRIMSVMPCSASDSPSMARVAMRTRLTPVDLDRNGTLREARGLTSMTNTRFELSTMNWMLNSPTMPMPRPSRVV